MNIPKIDAKMAAIVAAVAIVAIVGLSLFFKFDGITRQGADKETGIMAQYEASQVTLNNYANGLYESVNIADRKSEKINAIIADAISGRYGSVSGNPTGQADQALFNALVEAYPNLDNNLDLYDDIVSYVMAKRDAYTNDQAALVDRVRDYKKWLTSGLIDRQMIASAGYPSDDLTVTIDGVTSTGMDAVDAIIKYNTDGIGNDTRGGPILP